MKSTKYTKKSWGFAMDFTSEYWGFIANIEILEVNPNQCMATMALETKYRQFNIKLTLSSSLLKSVLLPTCTQTVLVLDLNDSLLFTPEVSINRLVHRIQGERLRLKLTMTIGNYEKMWTI